MTEKAIVECDWDRCDEQASSLEGAATPPDWGLLIDGEGNERHFCPNHIYRAVRWSCAGVSEGERLRVSHSAPQDGDIEHAHIGTETHGVQVEGFGAGKLQSGETDGLGIYVHDHLKVEIRGAHKEEPRVLVESDEFPTSLEVRDREGSLTELEVP